MRKVLTRRSYLDLERVPHFDALHPLRAEHVVRDELHPDRGRCRKWNDLEVI
jgi:hypothetical protein